MKLSNLFAFCIALLVFAAGVDMVRKYSLRRELAEKAATMVKEEHDLIARLKVRFPDMVSEPNDTHTLPVTVGLGKKIIGYINPKDERNMVQSDRQQTRRPSIPQRTYGRPLYDGNGNVINGKDTSDTIIDLGPRTRTRTSRNFARKWCELCGEYHTSKQNSLPRLREPSVPEPVKPADPKPGQL